MARFGLRLSPITPLTPPYLLYSRMSYKNCREQGARKNGLKLKQPPERNNLSLPILKSSLKLNRVIGEGRQG